MVSDYFLKDISRDQVIQSIHKLLKLIRDEEMHINETSHEERTSSKSYEIMQKLTKMHSNLESDCTIIFKEKLTILQKKYIVQNVSSVYNNDLFNILMKYFFKNKEKMAEFWT
jgi:hypothetical protein